MANVIAIELAILIAVLVWLGVSRVPSVQLRPIAEARPRLDDSIATVTRRHVARSQNLKMTIADPERESSVQAFEEQPQAAPEDVQELATETYVSSDPGEELVAETEPYYAAGEEVPVADSSEYYPEPVEQIVEFVQPSPIILVSNARWCERPRHRPTPSCDLPVAVRSPHPGGVSLPPPRNVGGGPPPRQNSAGGPAPRQVVRVRPIPPKRGLKTRWDP